MIRLRPPLCLRWGARLLSEGGKEAASRRALVLEAFFASFGELWAEDDSDRDALRQRLDARLARYEQAPHKPPTSRARAAAIHVFSGGREGQR